MNISVIELTRRLQNALDKNYNVSMKNDLRKKIFFFFLFFALDFIFQCWRQKKNGNENWNEKKNFFRLHSSGCVCLGGAHTQTRALVSPLCGPAFNLPFHFADWMWNERQRHKNSRKSFRSFVSFLSLSLGVCRCVEAKSFFLSFGCTWTVEWCDAKDAHRDLIWLFESVVWGGRTRLCARSLEKWD